MLFGLHCSGISTGCFVMINDFHVLPVVDLEYRFSSSIASVNDRTIFSNGAARVGALIVRGHIRCSL